ncbi:hypothetical protein [Chryseobacterium sp. c4a]|uniref:hypothetical protein n=1 Tax=Chryseobacterium sp. c4a TaxID=1573582 RepID=UPI0013578F96|nr:hypothetical protein [Chryseobacterium sp. c4a]
MIYKHFNITFKPPISQQRRENDEFMWKDESCGIYCILGADRIIYYNGIDSYWVFSESPITVLYPISFYRQEESIMNQGESVHIIGFSFYFTNTENEVIEPIKKHFFPFIVDIKQFQLLEKDGFVSLN